LVIEPEKQEQRRGTRRIRFLGTIRKVYYEWFSVAQESKGPDGGHWWFPTLAAMKLRQEWGTPFGGSTDGLQKQISFGNDRQKGKNDNKDKNRSRFPEGMTERKQGQKREATADSLWQ
jgi:hypothetical protein